MAIRSEQEHALDPQLHWKQVNYRPHRGQRVIHANEARHRVAACGRRFGKSQIGGHEVSFQPRMTRLALPYLMDSDRRHEIWCVGPEYSDAEKEFRVVWNDFRRMEVKLDRPGSYYNVEASELVASVFGGKLIIYGKSSKYPDSLVGEGLLGVVMCEAAKMKATIWPKYIRPALADERGWSLWLSTPEGKNHFYEQWQKGQDPTNEQWESWRMPCWANPFVFPLGEVDPEVAEMRSDMSEMRAAQELEASFTEYVGIVFKDFDEELHVTDLKYNRRYPVYGAIDFGWTNPFVYLAIQEDVWGNISVLGEYRCTNRDVGEIAEDLKHWPLARIAHTIYPDPAEPGDAHRLGKALKARVNLDTGGPLKDRLEYIRKSLKLILPHLEPDHPENRPKLLIDRSCTGLIREMQDYRYPDNKSEVRPDPEDPMDKDNHGPEALGRYFRGKYGVPTHGSKQGSKVRRANIGGRRSRR